MSLRTQIRRLRHPLHRGGNSATGFEHCHTPIWRTGFASFAATISVMIQINEVEIRYYNKIFIIKSFSVREQIYAGLKQ